MTVPHMLCTIDPATDGASSSQLLVLGSSLGTTTAVWAGALNALRASGTADSIRVLRFDLPGHGASPAASDEFTMAELADAVVRLVDESGGGRFHYAGLSLGGAIGIELALRHPGRLLSLGVFCSDARIGSEQGWLERAQQVATQGTPSLVSATPARWWASDFIAREPGLAADALNALSATDDASYILCCNALGGFDRTADVAQIVVPTIVTSGSGDPVTTPTALKELATAIPGAEYREIAEASHLAPMERPAEAAAILVEQLSAASADSYERGMRTRRAVLGDAHVDRAQAKITAETRAFQEFITRYAWGEVWSRPELSRRERSIATIASLVTGSHENEIAMHVRAALTNGLSRAEIAEVIMHTALYAGLPPANNALAIAARVFSEIDDTKPE